MFHPFFPAVGISLTPDVLELLPELQNIHPVGKARFHYSLSFIFRAKGKKHLSRRTGMKRNGHAPVGNVFHTPRRFDMMNAQACRSLQDAHYGRFARFLHESFHLGGRRPDKGLVKELAVVKKEKSYSGSETFRLTIPVHPFLSLK
jgi:hypothetical protein